MKLINAVPLLLLLACQQKNAEQASRWELSERKLYRNTLTKEGYLDTSYVKIYKLKSDVITDSVEGFVDHDYAGGALVAITYFEKKNGKYEATGSNSYEYAGGKIVRSLSNTFGVMTNNTMFEHDEKGRVKEQRIISIKTDGKQKQESDFMQVAQISGARYDSVRIVQEYDSLGRTPIVRTYDWNNNLLYTQVNLYTGTDPLQSFTITPKGDTLRRVKFQKEAKYEKMVVEGDSLINTRFNVRQWVLGSITENLRTQEKEKVVFSYDAKGFKREVKTYTLVRAKS